MPLDPLRSIPTFKTAFSDTNLSFCRLGLTSTALLVSLTVLLSGHLLLSTLPQLCATVRCCLLRRYIFIAVNFLFLVILSLRRMERNEETPEGGAPGEVSPDVWFDTVPSPTFGDVTSNNSEPTPAYSLQPTDPSPGDSVFNEPCLPTGYESPAPSPVPAALVGGIKPLEKAPAAPVEEDDDSMDATWKAITGRAPARAPYVKKSNTWDTPPRVQVEPAARGELRKSETFQEEEAAVAARWAVLERRIQGKEVAVAEDHDEMNRRFEAFIKKFNDQLRLQRLASLRRRRYMNMVYSASY